MNDRNAFRLADGRVFRMPDAPDVGEFGLVGNWRYFPSADLVGFYDESTQTGATLFAGLGVWSLQQPVTRDHFWLHCELLDRVKSTEPSRATSDRGGAH